MARRILFSFLLPLIVSIDSKALFKRLSGNFQRAGATLLFLTLILFEDQSMLPVEGMSDCSVFLSDDDVLDTFPVFVPRDRFHQHPSSSFAETDNESRIVSINLVDMKNIPSTLFCLSKLKSLTIERSTFRNHHQQLPAAIELLASSLVNIRIYDMPIITLPEQIGKLKLLETIELHWTGFVQFPQSMSALSSLRILSLINNNIASLPPWMRQLTALTQLILTNNHRLSSLQSLNGHPSLKMLTANNCSINQIPQNLPQLEKLDLSNNKLTSLKAIETLGNGKTKKMVFYFDNNRIRVIPRQIGLLKKLVELSLRNNSLVYLPKALMLLTSLTKINLIGNALIRRDVEELKKRMESVGQKLEVGY